MRRLETAVREQKGIKAMAQASGDKLAVRECNERIKRYQGKYKEISDITGIAQDKKRMTLTKSADSGKIKEKTAKKVTPITDNAINTVKKVDIDGFDDKQNEYIHNQHKELLKYARDNNDNNEVAFVFRKDLSDKAVFKGDNDSVDFGNALIGKGDELFVMHNHPGNSSFSNTDLRFVISDDNVNTLTIVKNNGFVEVLTKSEDYNAEKAKVYLKRAYKKYVFDEMNDEQIDNAIRYFLNHNGGNFKWTK